MPHRLVTSTSDLVVADEPLPGLPLFRSDHDSIVPVPSLWTIHCYRDRGFSLRTVWTYAECLRLFLDSQEQAEPGVGWERATKDDVVRFKREMIGRGNDPNTVSLRLAALDGFFAWTLSSGFRPSRPFKVKSRSAKTTTIGNHDSVPVVGSPAGTRKERRIYTPETFERIRVANPLKDATLRKRVDLMFRWGWGTGLREAEVVGLSVRKVRKAILDELAEPTASDRRDNLVALFHRTGSPSFVVDLIPGTTKGSRGGSVMVPRELMKATAEWIEGGRAGIPVGKDAYDAVFVSSDGGRIAPSTLCSYFSRSVRRSRSGGCFHSLRHSWATRVLSEFHRLGHPALGELFVQNQLRHAARATTAAYVHVVEMTAHAGAVNMAVNRAFA